MKDFSPCYGIMPPLITPFTQDKEIDWYTYDKLVDWHIERGVDSLFVVCGSSEYFTLTEEEALKMARAASKRANGRIFVVAGSTIYPNWEDLDKNIEMTKRMAETGVNGCFVTLPRTGPADMGGRSLDDHMVEWHRTIHDAVDFPLYAYEMPGAVENYKFSAEAFAALGEMDHYIGIKDTTCVIEQVKAKLDAAKGSIKIIDANTPNLLATLQLGATGGINTSANVCPSLFSKMYRLFKAGDIATAEKLREKIVEIDSMMWGYVMCAKIAVNMMGIPSFQFVTRKKSPEFTPERMQVVKDMVELTLAAEKEFDAYN